MRFGQVAGADLGDGDSDTDELGLSLADGLAVSVEVVVQADRQTASVSKRDPRTVTARVCHIPTGL